MKHKIIHFITLLIFLVNQTSLGQIPQPNNDVFITNEVIVNSDKLEFSPTFFENGILFISTNPVNKKFTVKDTRIGKNIMSIFRSERNEEGKLQQPEPFAVELLSTVHEGPLTFDRTVENMFFTRNNFKGKKLLKASDGIVKLQIYSAQRMDNVWKNVEKLTFNDRNSNAAHPSISVENDQIYFTSDRPGGIGGMDLYVSTKTGDTWGEPVNLGPKINTDKDEVFPFIHADGTLYFSSNGHPGSGDLDVFTVTKTDGNWGIPENMGAPFNSNKDDFGIIIDRDKRNGYFSSSREGGIGEDDIYSFFALNGLEKNVEPEPDIEKAITIKINDDETGETLSDAIITYMKLDELSLSKAITGLSSAENSGEDEKDLVLKLPIDENAKTGFSDANGEMTMVMNRGNYVIKVEKEGYITKQLALNSNSEILEYAIPISKYNPLLANNNGGNGSGNGNSNGPNGSDGTSNVNSSDIGIGNENGNNSGNGNGNGADIGNGNNSGNGNSGTGDPFVDGGLVVSETIEEGTVIELTNIYYNFNESTIRPDAQVDLDGLAEFLIKYPNTEIELISHTDSRGKDRYNNKLSQRRAEKAVDYLVRKGIDRNKVTPTGAGESQLRNGCNDFADCTEAQHQFNRRTEIRIIKMDAPITVKFINNEPQVISEAPRSVRKTRSNSSDSNPINTSISGSDFGDDSYDPDGNYKVIAGAFSNIGNAEKRLVVIRELGFNNADILKFGDQGLFHVVVSRYKSNQDAFRTVRKLKAKNVKSFVKN